MRSLFVSLATLVVFGSACSGRTYEEQWSVDGSKRPFRYVKDDPAHVRAYQLENGLTVYLARRPESSHILYATCVRSGSKCDPIDHTGLAHYLEHLLFNGTSQIGSLNWARELPLLAQLDSLYELCVDAVLSPDKIDLFRVIDSISFEASRFGVKGEYRRLVSDIGGVSINAVTNTESIVFGTLLPSGSLKAFLNLEQERFRDPAFRAFSTELEIVFEEYNMMQNNPFIRKYHAMNEALFPEHPYGTRTNIGKAAHLKNPSMRATKQYFREYFVPGNMAVSLAGNLDYDSAIAWVETAFGQMPAHVSNQRPTLRLPPITRPIEVRLSGAKNPSVMIVMIGFRLDGAGSKDEKCLMLLDRMFMNRNAGLIKQHLAGNANIARPVSHGFYVRTEYSAHYLEGYVPDGVAPDTARDCLLGELTRIKAGDFESWLVKAAAIDLKKQFVADIPDNLETLCSRAFTLQQTWKEQLDFMESLSEVSKDDIVEFARRNYRDNFVVVYDLSGPTSDSELIKLPLRTILLNDDSISSFARVFAKYPIKRDTPVFLNYSRDLAIDTVRGDIEIASVKMSNEALFEVTAVFPVGTYEDPLLDLTLKYCDAAGTKHYPGPKFGWEFYKRGIEFETSAESHRTIFRVSGLAEDLESGLDLLRLAITDVAIDTNVLSMCVQSEQQSRNLNETNPGQIRRWLRRRVLYGAESPIAHPPTHSDLDENSAGLLAEKIHRNFEQKHTLLYCGNDSQKFRKLATEFYRNRRGGIAADGSGPAEFLPTRRRVLLANTDGNSVEVLALVRGNKFDRATMAASNMFNRFFEKICFKEIRESNSLAYETWGSHDMSSDTGGWNITQLFGATQPDKLVPLMGVMTKLLGDISKFESVFEESKADQLNRYRSERFLDSDIYWTAATFRKQGISHDFRADMYETICTMTFDDIKRFFNGNIAGRDITFIVIGPLAALDSTSVAQFGASEVVDLHELFDHR